MVGKLVVAVCVLVLALTCQAQTEPAVVNLKCEGRVNPLGIDTPQPRLSWQLTSSRRGESQTAYRILVASSEELLAPGKTNLWDSGDVKSSDSISISYAGRTLRAGQTCYWKVRIWDRDAKPSDWSTTASWAMGQLSPADWRGKWIGPRQGRPLLIDYGLGFHALPSDNPDQAEWVQIDLGTTFPIEQIRLHPLNHDGVEGFGFPLRFRIDLSDDPAFATSTTLADYSHADYPNPGFHMVSFPAAGINARFVRYTGLKQWRRPHGDRKYCFGLGEMEVISSGTVVSGRKKVEANHSYEGSGWSAAQLVDSCSLAPGVEDYNARQDAANREREALSRGETPEDPHHAAILMRNEITITKPVKRATAFASGLGWSELHIDGNKISDAVLSPAFSSYNRSINYVTHDVTAALQQGHHTLGVLLGNGWLNTPERGYLGVYTNKPWTSYPKLLLNLTVEYADGTTGHFSSNDSWKWSTGEITLNDGWRGEDVDMRLARPGWDRNGYDDSKWRRCLDVPSPGGKLISQQTPPIRVCETIYPTNVKGGNGTWEFSIPFLSSGWPRLKTHGPAGTTITLTWGNDNHSTFTLAGTGEEIYEPRFVFESIQKVVVSGLTHAPEKDTLVVQAVHADLADTGGFECSDAYLNNLQEALRRTNSNYTYDFPLDPTREKSGWTQDIETMLETASLNFDMAAVYRNWLKDFREAQHPDGYVPGCAPGDFEYPHLNGPWWGGMIVWGPWHHYLYYGDRRVLEENYAAMKSFVDYMTSRAGADHILTWGLGDWLCPDGKKTPVPMTSTAAYSSYARIVSDTARLLSKKDDATSYARLATQVRDAFNAKWLDAQTGLYKGNYQTMQALAWALGLPPEQSRADVLARLLDDIKARKDHLNTGFVGTPYLIHTLIDSGNIDVLSRIAHAKDFPGWNTLMHDGVFFEDWHGGNVQMPSCGGSIGLFLIQGLGGITPDPQQPGFKHVILRPQIAQGITWVKSHHDSPYGRIESNWSRDGRNLKLHVAVPVNTTALVYVPSADPSAILESGHLASSAAGVLHVTPQKNCALLDLASGTYDFTSVMPEKQP